MSRVVKGASARRVRQVSGTTIKLHFFRHLGSGNKGEHDPLKESTLLLHRRTNALDCATYWVGGVQQDVVRSRGTYADTRTIWFVSASYSIRV